MLFMRLQRTLIDNSTDESIFAWSTPPAGLSCYRSLGHIPIFESKEWGLIVPSPDCFLGSKDIVILPNLYVPRLGGGYQWGQQGVTFQMPIATNTELKNFWGVVRRKTTMSLNCWRYDDDGVVCAVVLELVKMGKEFIFKRVKCDVLRKEKGAKPANNRSGGADQILTVPMTIPQPEFDPFV